jgi:hypothetical protein
MLYIDVNGDSIGYVLEMIKTGLEKAERAVNKAAGFALDPIFGSGTAINNLDVKMKGNTYGELEGCADAALTGGAVKDLPDYGAITVSGDFIVGGGVGGDVNLGYVKGDGVFVNATGRTGSGFDMSVGVGISFGSYRGTNRKTSATELSGPGTYQNAALGSFSGGIWQDVGHVKETGLGGIGKNWIGSNAGVSVGSRSLPLFTGSFGASYTTKPFYIYKMK